MLSHVHAYVKARAQDLLGSDICIQVVLLESDMSATVPLVLMTTFSMVVWLQGTSATMFCVKYWMGMLVAET